VPRGDRDMGSRANVKPDSPCTNCGRNLWIPGNRTSVLGLCWHCVPPKVDVQADISGAMSLEDDEPGDGLFLYWFPGVNGTGQGFLF